MDDYYQLLDVAPDAPREDIRGAYRAKRDALQAEEGDQTRAEIARLNRAWNVLSDPAQRERYDGRLAEQRESGEVDDDDDDGDDDDDDDRRPIPVTRAGRRDAARDRRGVRKQTIVVPAGLTMAPNRSRLTALGTDLLVLLLIFVAVYQLGLSLVDRHFPGERHRGSDLVSQQNDVVKKVNADKKRASDAEKSAAAAKLRHDSAGEAKANEAVAAARAAQARDTKADDRLRAQIDKVNKKLGPWINLVFVAAMLVILLYLVPSTAISGQTVGKRLQRIRVVRLDGSRPGWSCALVRFGVPVLVGTFLAVLLRFGPLGLVVALLGMVGWISNPNRQGLHDRLAKTIVVEA
jgi:curved DNA-binding protein CbpA